MSFEVGAIADPRTYTNSLRCWWSAGSGHSKGTGTVQKVRNLNQGVTGAVSLVTSAGADPALTQDGLEFDGTNKMSGTASGALDLGASPGMLIAFTANGVGASVDYPCFFYTAGATDDGLLVRITSGLIRGQSRDSLGSTYVDSTLTLTGDGSWHVALVERQGANIAISVDGGAFVTEVCSGTMNVSHGGVDAVAAVVGGASPSLGLDGRISDVFVFDANLSSPQRDQFMAYLNAKHGTAF